MSFASEKLVIVKTKARLVQNNGNKTMEKQTEHPAGEINSGDGFADQSQSRSPSVLAEFVDFLVHNKKWWLTPIVLVLLILSFFVLMTSTALGPFIYVLF